MADNHIHTIQYEQFWNRTESEQSERGVREMYCDPTLEEKIFSRQICRKNKKRAEETMYKTLGVGHQYYRNAHHSGEEGSISKNSTQRVHRQWARTHQIFILDRALLNRNEIQVKLDTRMKFDLLDSSACSQMTVVS